MRTTTLVATLTVLSLSYALYLLSKSAPSFLGYHSSYIPRHVKILRNILSISFSIFHNHLDHDLVSFKFLNRSSRSSITQTGTITTRKHSHIDQALQLQRCRRNFTTIFHLLNDEIIIRRKLDLKLRCNYFVVKRRENYGIFYDDVYKSS